VHPLTVLLVEDDVGVQFFIWKLLKGDGFMVLKAGDGEAALETCRKHPGSVDLLVTDREMPQH
jgi:CheY-like chemotaxis protein